MHENDNIVMIFKVVGNDITNNYFIISKNRYRSLASMLTFSRDWKQLELIVVDESHTVEIWTGKRFVR